MFHWILDFLVVFLVIVVCADTIRSFGCLGVNPRKDAS